MKKSYLLVLSGIFVGIFGVLQLSPIIAQPDKETSPNSEQPAEEALAEEASEIDPRYSQLREYLQQENWEAADRETYQVMLIVAGSKSEEQGRFDLAEWQNFPCEELKQIDNLWIQASEGKLGFSTQKDILANVESYNRYYVQIGWKKGLIGDDVWEVVWEYNEETKKVEYLPDKNPNFDNPPKGHLPAKLEWEVSEDGRVDHRFEAISRCDI